MRLLYIRLENYIGIYNGRGDNVLEVDLTKSTSNIIIIRGSNGSGKSTLLKSLSPLQNDNSDIIPGLEGRKVLRYEFRGDIYEIEYIHPVKGDGSRGQVKMQVYKGLNREPLNPTWNITAGKDIIYSLFNLDTNFLTLAQLSSEDRGLADKRPSERKKFVNSIINGIEVYNNMYKTISKKHSVYKSQISNLTSKIAKIGNQEDLNTRYINITNQVKDMSSRRDSIIIEVTKINSKIDDLTNKNNMEEYYTNQREYKRLSSVIKSIKSDIIELIKCGIDNTEEIILFIDSKSEETMNNLHKIDNETSKLEVELESVKKDQSNIFEDIQVKKSKLNSLIDFGFTKDDMDLYNSTKSKIELLDKDLENVDIRLSSFAEAESIINAVESFIPIIDSIYNPLKVSTKEDIINFADIVIESNWSFVDNSVNIAREIEKINRNISDLDGRITVYKEYLSKAIQLQFRPKDCKIDSCRFIVDAVNASKEEPEKNIELLSKEIDSLNKEKKDLLIDYEISLEQKSFIERFRNLYNVILSYRSLLDKSNLGFLYEPRELLKVTLDISKINEKLNQIRFVYNTMVSRDNLVKILKPMEESATKYISNKSLIDSLNTDIDSLTGRYNQCNKNIESISDRLSLLERDNDTYGKMLDNFKLAKDKANKLKISEESIESIRIKINSMENVASQLDDLNRQLQEKSLIADNINNTLNDLLKERDQIGYNKTLLEDYKRDLDMYNENYSKLETIKYYVSPTTGIQTVFMGTYMNNIILKANELLSLIFNGQFIIQPFVINESEFRIPCLGNGIINDDISSMSTSQICMISMILSFAILSNSSTDYNILKLDEIDGGLDTENRIQFIELLKQLIRLVGCEQCFLISHNMEYDESVNVIDMSARPVVVR